MPSLTATTQYFRGDRNDIIARVEKRARAIGVETILPGLGIPEEAVQAKVLH